MGNGKKWVDGRRTKSKMKECGGWKKWVLVLRDKHEQDHMSIDAIGSVSRLSPDIQLNKVICI